MAKDHGPEAGQVVKTSAAEGSGAARPGSPRPKGDAPKPDDTQAVGAINPGPGSLDDAEEKGDTASLEGDLKGGDLLEETEDLTGQKLIPAEGAESSEHLAAAAEEGEEPAAE